MEVTWCGKGRETNWKHFAMDVMWYGKGQERVKVVICGYCKSDWMIKVILAVSRWSKWDEQWLDDQSEMSSDWMIRARWAVTGRSKWDEQWLDDQSEMSSDWMIKVRWTVTGQSKWTTGQSKWDEQWLHAVCNVAARVRPETLDDITTSQPIKWHQCLCVNEGYVLSF